MTTQVSQKNDYEQLLVKHVKLQEENQLLKENNKKQGMFIARLEQLLKG